MDARSAGRDLGVQAVLTGRVVQLGDELSISVELADAGDNTHIWGERYNRKLTDVVSLQTEIARDVSRKLRARLSGADEQKLAKNYTSNVEAYQLYLKARYHYFKRTEPEIRKSIDFTNKRLPPIRRTLSHTREWLTPIELCQSPDTCLPKRGSPKRKQQPCALWS